MIPEGHDWSRIDTGLIRYPLGTPQLGVVAATATKLALPDIRHDLSWIVDRDWVMDEDIIGLTGKRLRVHDRTLGVLELYTRVEMQPALCGLTGLLANHAAISIANAETYAENLALRRELEIENAHLKPELDGVGTSGDIVGSSTAMQQVQQRIALCAPTDALVLISGES